MEPAGLVLLAGDASVDSWFREIHVPKAWHVYLVTGLDFHQKKSVLVLGRFEPNFGINLLPCHFLWREDDEDYFSPKLCVRIKDNNSPHCKVHQFLVPFFSKFSDLNFTSYICSLYLPLKSIKSFCSCTIGLNLSRDRIFPSWNWGISEISIYHTSE